MGPPPTAASGAAGGEPRQTPGTSSAVSQSAASGGGLPSPTSASPSTSSAPPAASSISPLIAASSSTPSPAPYGPPRAEAIPAPSTVPSISPPPSSPAGSGAPTVSPSASPESLTNAGDLPSSPALLQQAQPAVRGGGPSRHRGENRTRRSSSGARSGALSGPGANSASGGPQRGDGGSGSLSQHPGKGGRGDGGHQQAEVAATQEVPHPRGNEGGSAPGSASTPALPDPPPAATSQTAAGGSRPPRAPPPGDNRGPSGGGGTHHKWRTGGGAALGGGPNNGSPANPVNANAQKFYKTRPCPWYLYGRCIHGDQCSWAHSEQELRGFGGARNPGGVSPSGNFSAGGRQGDGGKSRERTTGSGGGGLGGQAHDGLVSTSGASLKGPGLEGSDSGGSGGFGRGPHGVVVAADASDRGMDSSQGHHSGAGGPKGAGALGAPGGGLVATEATVGVGPPVSDRTVGSELPHHHGGSTWGGSLRGSTSTGSSYHHPQRRSGGVEGGGAASGRSAGGMPHYPHHSHRESRDLASDAGGPRCRGTGVHVGTGDRPLHGQHAHEGSGSSVLSEAGAVHPGGGKHPVGGGTMGGTQTGGAGTGARGGGGHGTFHYGPGGSRGPDKRKSCPYLSRKSGCFRGAECRFAHSEEEALNATGRHQTTMTGFGGLSADGSLPGSINSGGPHASTFMMMQRGDPDGLTRREGLVDPAEGFPTSHPKISENYALVGAMSGYDGASFIQGPSLPSQLGMEAERGDGRGHDLPENRALRAAGGLAGSQGEGDKRDLPATGAGGTTAGSRDRGGAHGGFSGPGGALLQAGLALTSFEPGGGGLTGSAGHPHHAQGGDTAAQGHRGTGPHSRRDESGEPGGQAGGNGAASRPSSGSARQTPGSHTSTASREQLPQHPTPNAVAAAAVSAVAGTRLPPSLASMGSYWLQMSPAAAHPLPHSTQPGSLISPGGPAASSGPLGSSCVPPFGAMGSTASQQHALMMGAGGPHTGHPGSGMLPPGNQHGLYLAPGTPISGAGAPGGSSGLVGVVPVPMMQFIASTEELNAAAPLFYED
ncbi:zinc finger (CCCH type) motif-containing protein [Toxoplasma gondii p89]|uniref:Zinc finger (CCCH type) motif-containing protein n=1 Tax=Toxoplasma gondii p89 TaxID=943119 RepID=A0A086K862_TOXGO|nr:zinc finger (CCCH type) motif-containing protein [Toxoplasma gondii p89]